jgi:nitrite reductase/ring-hydroxylating ferredoxin subunit
MPCDDCLSRREFLARGTLVVAAVAAGCGDGHFGPTEIVLSGRTVSFKVSTVPALATTGQWVLVPTDTDYRAVKRTGPTTFAGISVICTHEGCPTDLRGGGFVCPCHGAEYDTDGQVTRQPDSGRAKGPLPGVTVHYDAATDTLTVG